MMTIYVYHLRYIYIKTFFTQIRTYQQDALPGHPPDRKHSPSFYSVVVRAVQAAAHSKIRDLDAVVGADQAITCCQVSMHHIEGF